jgi:hypothetical protein
MKDYEIIMLVITFNPDLCQAFGDHRQLVSLLLSDAGRKVWSISLFERQLRAGCLQTTLELTHRTNSEAVAHINDLFYHGTPELAIQTTRPRR